MTFDADNPVVKLCAEGMAAEHRGDHAEAKRLFALAWGRRQGDLDAAIAAHYVARHSDDPREALRWNLLALEHAERLPTEQVSGMLPSLYLNLGKAHEDLGERTAAAHWYARAEKVLGALGDDRYGAIVRDAVARGRARVSS